jgi:hypothetical protein
VTVGNGNEPFESGEGENLFNRVEVWTPKMYEMAKLTAEDIRDRIEQATDARREVLQSLQAQWLEQIRLYEELHRADD